MNSQLIEKVIKTQLKTCPPINYENPLIDRDVASALSKSFMKILNSSNPSNNCVKTTVLNSIRKICQSEPENHIKVEENLTNLLTKLYVQEIDDKLKTGGIERELDEFLIRSLKELTLNSNYEYSTKPEIIQSLLNLDENVISETLLKNIIHLGNSNKQLILNLWNNDSLNCTNYDDISIKLKSEIENILLKTCHTVFVENDLNFKHLFECNPMNKLVHRCTKSSYCFQICCNILNYILIETNFNIKIQKLISLFVNNIQLYCNETIAILYPSHLSHIVLLLDININSLPDCIRNTYTQKVSTKLSRLQVKSQNDVVMLFSHFPHWFDILVS